jgi:hypothetical protein
VDVVRQIADAVLYEGYMLWPYRRSALKNQHRFTIGGLYPPRYANRSSDRSRASFEFLLEGDLPHLQLELRCLLPLDRNGNRDEARETTTIFEDISAETVTAETFRLETVEASLHVEPMILRSGLRRIRVALANRSEWEGDSRDEALWHTLAAAHLVARTRDGAFVSTIDPPSEYAREAAACRQDGLWPVLVGEPGDRSTLLAAPIILEDYPRVSPESPGDTFDGCEIDELLVHSIRALTDQEKREIREGDPRARAILERADALPREMLARLHGTLRETEI